MLQRNLLYTGITRGKRLVVLVGQRKAVAIAVKNVSGRRRWSKLDEWLSGAEMATSPSEYLAVRLVKEGLPEIGEGLDDLVRGGRIRPQIIRQPACECV